MNAIHIKHPRKETLRAAVQSLAGRSRKPFRTDGYFSGLIDPSSWDVLVEGELTKNIQSFRQEDGSYVLSLDGTGVKFIIVEYVLGAFIFSKSDPTYMAFRP